MNIFKRKRTLQDDPQVNLTPLIDVVFVILIMFIVIAPLLELDRIDLAEAASTTKEYASGVSEKSPITIRVGKDNIIKVNEKVIEAAFLQKTFQLLKEAYPLAKPQLFHDKKAYFGSYQLVKNALEEAGFEQLDIILIPG